MEGTANNLNDLLQGLSLEEQIRPVSPSQAPPWFFSSVDPRHVNYSELEPAPPPIHHEWKPEPRPSDEELRKSSEEAQKPLDLKDIDLEINIQLNSESHKKFKKSIKEYQKKKKEQSLALSSNSKKTKRKVNRKVNRKDKRDLEKHIKEAEALGIDPQISAMEFLMGNMKV